MLIVLALLMSLGALFVVAYPILARSQNAAPAIPAEETLEDLLATRDSLFQALRELGFDRAVGKVTEEDYQAFNAHLRQSAAESLKAIDRWEEQLDGEIGGALEAEIAARASALQRGITCPACGRQAAEGERFCAACGTSLAVEVAGAPVASLACPSCGRPAEAGDRFCAACGKPLALVGVLEQGGAAN